MAGSASSVSSTPTAVDSENAEDTTPLLHNVESQDPSAVVNAPVGYQTIPVAALGNEAQQEPEHSLSKVFAILSVLLIGVFISQADGTLLIATMGTITSEFDDLQNSGWLFSAYGLATCVAQPLYGKLSDIFGRKRMLQVAYFLFASGGAICGLGQSMSQIIIGRAIQGTGGAGMVVLVSILITDLVPLREVASYRSYVNIVQTVGRSCGGPIGGALAQTIGWRWAFLTQAPLTVIAMILVAWKLQIKPKGNAGTKSDNEQLLASKLQRIDFFGAIFMSATILSAMLILDMGGEKIPWTSPTIAILGIITLASATFFYLVEKHVAKEPIFPLRLLSHRDVVLDYILNTFQMASQMALMLYIPLYFQITKNASPAEGGAYMVPSVMGNTSGGLLTGYYVKRTARYKLPLVIAGLSSIFCFTLLLSTWHGNTPVWQSLFVFFGGFGTGTVVSAVFVDMAAGVDDSEMAIASSGLYLSSNIGAVIGVTAASALFANSLKSKLAVVLASWPNGNEIADKAASNVEYVQELTGKLHELVISAYVFAFRHSFVFSLCCATGTLICALIVKEKKLHH